MNRRQKAIVIAVIICIPLVALASFRGDMMRNYFLDAIGDAIVPMQDDTTSLGTSSYEFKDLYIDGTAYIDTLDATTVGGQTFTRTLSYQFYDPDVADAQNYATLGMDPSESVGGTEFTGIVMPWAGSVVGISVKLSGACTGGTLTAVVDRNATTDTISVSLESTTNTTTNYAVAAADVYPFAAGEYLGVELLTTGTFAPTTADLVVDFIVEF